MAVAGAPPVFHFAAQSAQIVRGDLGQQPIVPDRKNVTIENCFPHGVGALRHARFLEPTLAHSPEVLSN
jgi:hypothetical protein